MRNEKKGVTVPLSSCHSVTPSSYGQHSETARRHLYAGSSGRPYVSVGFRAERSGVRIPALSVFCWVATLGKLFTHIASPVFSAARNWGYKREYSDRTSL